MNDRIYKTLNAGIDFICEGLTQDRLSSVKSDLNRLTSAVYVKEGLTKEQFQTLSFKIKQYKGEDKSLT